MLVMVLHGLHNCHLTLLLDEQSGGRQQIVHIILSCYVSYTIATLLLDDQSSGRQQIVPYRSEWLSELNNCHCTT